MKCEICGKESNSVKLSRVYIVNYGNRSQVERMMCKSCRNLEKKGELENMNIRKLRRKYSSLPVLEHHYIVLTHGKLDNCIHVQQSKKKV